MLNGPSALKQIYLAAGKFQSRYLRKFGGSRRPVRATCNPQAIQILMSVSVNKKH